MPAPCHIILAETKVLVNFFPVEFNLHDPLSFTFNKEDGVYLDQKNFRES